MVTKPQITDIGDNATRVVVVSLTHSSLCLNNRYGIKDDRATTFLHSSLSSAFRRASPNPKHVHSDILSPHMCFYLPFLLPPPPFCTEACRINFVLLILVCVIRCLHLLAYDVDTASFQFHHELTMWNYNWLIENMKKKNEKIIRLNSIKVS